MNTRNADPHRRFRTLILGGTEEARLLAAALVAEGLAVTTSLAGRTASPVDVAGEMRSGGFGGAAGLAECLRENGFDALVDATHPFAAQISANAVVAAAEAGVAALRLARPAWPIDPSWIMARDFAHAATLLPAGARVMLTIGRQEVAAFFGRDDCQFVARVIKAPDGAPPAWTIISERGPFSVGGETALLAAQGITHLVSKNSGGAAVAAKLAAARALGVLVIMIARPELPPATEVGSVEDAAEWVRDQARLPNVFGSKSSPA